MPARRIASKTQAVPIMSAESPAAAAAPHIAEPQSTPLASRNAGPRPSAAPVAAMASVAGPGLAPIRVHPRRIAGSGSRRVGSVIAPP